MAIKHSITLSTTEPNNEVGVIKIRQADEQTQTLEVQITENGVPKSYQGLAVYFCAKLGQTAGLGIIEQKLKPEEMTNPANGKLEYTMRAEDWQILGRQKGYFSFRKMKDEHEFVEQFTTRDFTFDVIKSVYSDGLKEVKKDGSTYVWTIEDLIRLFNEYMASGKTDWEEFVEQNREILESVDPGGKLIGELIDARRPFGGDAYATLGERLDSEKTEVSAQLAQSIQYLNVKSFGAVGDGITDDTQAIKETLLQATAQNKGVRFPAGNYLITEQIVIEDNGITKVTGDGQEKTKLIFDVYDFALVLKTYYTRPVELSNLTITPKVKSIERNGIKVSNDNWGSGVRLDNVNIFNFGGISLNLIETFNSSFNNMEIRAYNEGSTRYGTILKIDKIRNFGSNNTFTHVVFHIAKIGIQNFAGASYDFTACTFENLDLFLNIKQLEGLSMNMSFDSCWYESVDRGIINSEINELTLLPLKPITKKAPVNRLFFRGNTASTTTWDSFLDMTTNPFDYKHFTLYSGYKYADSSIVRKLKFSENFTSTDSFIETYNLMDLNYRPYGDFTEGSYIIHVKVMNDAGKIMRASFISDNYRVHLLGDVYDPDSIGTSSKISPRWNDTVQMSMRVYGVNLVSCTFTVLYTEM